MNSRKVKNALVGLVISAVLTLNGCASRWYPKDYQGRPVFYHTGEMWEKTGEDLTQWKTAYKAPVRGIGAILTTVNDSVELLVRGPTNIIAQATDGVPVVDDITDFFDYALNTTLDSIWGGKSFNDGFGNLGNLSKNEWYERSVAGFITEDYVAVEDRMKLEGKEVNYWRVGVEGTLKTTLRFASIFAPFMGGGGGGGGGKTTTPVTTPVTTPGPTPVSP